MPARGPVAVLALYRMHIVCAGVRCERLVFAPDARSAARIVREHASVFGLAHERVVVVRATPLSVREAAA